ncbi:MAG TPA: DUF2135 domain-containing protein [Bacteroidetes bacterium]|nr:DUF2135 domain-containing protein [Bacteroidota bacterium]
MILPMADAPGDSVRKVRGRVIDQVSGLPLSGVLLKLDRSQSSCFTDMQGEFLLTVFKKDRKLTLEYLDYELLELDVRAVGPDVTLEMFSQQAANARDAALLSGVDMDATVVEIPGLQGVPVTGKVAQVPENALVVVDGVLQAGMPQLDPGEVLKQEYVLANRAISLYGGQAAAGMLVITTTNAASAAGTSDFLALPAWDPAMPYLDALRTSPGAERYPRYLELREIYGASPAFFLDVANLFIKNNQISEALRILSNLSEFDLGNHEVLRTLGFCLQGLDQPETAISFFRKVKQLRPQEPQSYRDLALALQDIGQYQEALDLFDALLRKDWSEVDDLFWGIHNIALMEMNALIANSPVDLNLDNIDSRLIRSLPVKLRIVVDWNRIDTDIDLSIIGPHGPIEGQKSADMVDGYGPETFLLKKAQSGEYQILVDYFDESTFNITGQTFLKISVFTDYGTPQQKRQIFTHRMTEKGDKQGVVRFRID